MGKDSMSQEVKEKELGGDEAEQSAEQPKWSNLPTVSFRKLQRKTLGQILVESEALCPDQPQTAREQQQQEGSSAKLGEMLVQNEMVTEEGMLRALAYQLDLPYYARPPVNDIDPTLV